MHAWGGPGGITRAIPISDCLTLGGTQSLLSKRWLHFFSAGVIFPCPPKPDVCLFQIEM
jgi:hypothetical protein